MIGFIADIHLLLRAKNIPTNWAIKRYNILFEQIYNIPCSRLILGGDIFDKVPSMEELALYFNLISGIKVPCIIFSGNHEMQKKTQSFLSHLKEPTKLINPLVEIVDEIYEESNFTILSYEFIKDKKNWDKIKTNIVFSHLRGSIPPHVVPEIPLEWLERFDVVYAGDLHSHSNSQGNLIYPGSPCTTSFHRHEVDTGYLLIDEIDLTKWTWHKFNVPQLIRKTVSDPEEMIETDFHRTIYELEGSVVDLSNIKNNELLDKKLVKRSTDTTLILNKEMSVEDELVEYFRYILELPDNQIQEAITVFNDYITDT